MPVGQIKARLGQVQFSIGLSILSPITGRCQNLVPSFRKASLADTHCRDVAGSFSDFDG